MTITTPTGGGFDQDLGRAKKAASDGPVFITHDGRPAYVLLTIEDYEKLIGRPVSIVDLLSMPESEYVEFDPPRLEGPFWQPVDFS